MDTGHNWVRANRMVALIEEIYPLPRMLNSSGLDRAFEILRRELPSITVHEYPSGMECDDWIVPSSWRVTDGFLKDESGFTIASIEENILFVAPYSESVDGWFTKEEIAKHLRTRPDRPNAFALEHRHAYNYRLVDWGITLPYQRWINLPEGKYHVKIEVERQPGSMKVAEYSLAGRRPETICICAHCDELCNDDLSGCVVAMELMRSIEQRSERQYSYQMLLVPETIGTFFFVASSPEKVRNTVGMLDLETVGAGIEWCLKKALQQDTRIERALRMALRAEGVPYRELGFFEGYVNDEKVYAWPTIGVPGVSLQRFPFAEYHTSDDTPAIISSQYLLKAVEIGEALVDIMEKDYIPQYTGQLPPWLTRHGLYYDLADDAERFYKFNTTLLFSVDGQHSVLDLAGMIDLNFHEVYDYLNRFGEQGFIKKLDVTWKL